MNQSKLSEYFEFTHLDQKRSIQLKKEYPYLLPNKNEQGITEIILGPHTTSIYNDFSNYDPPIGKCSCVYFEKRNTCHHLHFLLGLINEKIETSQNTSTKEQKKKSLPTIKKMLDSIDDDVLKSFVIQYSRKHKAFSIVLKARLLRSNTISDSTRNYYLELMNQIIHQRSSPSNPLTIGQLNTFIDVVDVFLDEIVSCKEEKDYLNYYHIIYALLDRVNLVLHRTPKKAKNIIPLWVLCHQQMTILMDRVDAPELKDEILISLGELATKVYYQFCDYNLNIVHLIINNIRDKTQLDKLSNALIDALKHKSASEWRIGHQAAIIQLLFINKHDSSLLNYCREHMQSSYIYIEIARVLQSANQTKISSKLLQIGHQLLNNGALHEAYIQINMYSWSKENLYRELYIHLVQYKSIGPLNEIGQSKSFNKGFTEFLAQKNELSNEILAKVYKFLNEPKLLLKTLGAIPLGHLQQYDSILWKNQPIKVRSYYEERIKLFLDEFHGNKAAEFIDNILNAIIVKAPNQEFDKLLEFIKTNYSHRSALLSITKQFKRSYF